MFHKTFIASIFLLFSLQLIGQANIPTGGWRVHLPYANCTELTETPVNHLAIAELGSFYHNKKDGSIERLSKVQGFSEVAMAVAKYNFEKGLLLVAYKNGNIDIIKDNVIINIDAFLKKSIQGEKNIYHIHFYKQYALLSTSYGLLVLDLDKEEIKESYTNIANNGAIANVKASTTMGDSIYIATPEGVFAALNKSSVNLASFTNWNRLGTLPGGANHVTAYKGSLYADPDSNFSVYNNGWIDIENNGKDELQSLTVCHDKLVAARNGKIMIFEGNTIVKTYSVNTIKKAIIDDKGELWMVVNGFGLLLKTDANEYAVIPNGPNFSTSFSMVPVLDDLWVMGGGFNRGFDPLFSNAGYGRFTNGEWINRSGDVLLDNLRDFTHATYSSTLGEFIIATQSSGVVSYNTNFQPVKVYDESNSSLRKNQANNFLISNGAAFDNNNNLWISNSSHPDSNLSVRTPDGKWKAFRLVQNGSVSNIKGTGKIVVDKNNYKWIITPLSNTIGILVYDDNNTPLNEFDDRYVEITSKEGSGKLINNNVVSLSLDKDGEMWIGTSQGLCVIRDPKRVFDGPGKFESDRLIITQGNKTDYLLGDEIINDLKTDGGNRKWIATNRGVFLISKNADSILFRFNTDNSPLLSNLVYTVGIQPNSGEIFFGTQEGIISYRGFATDAKENLDNIKVFPNPVRSGFEGFITITNLKENSLVKITDLNGQLVSEGRSNGGTLVWNGRNLNNEKISSGVYLVFVADEKAEETNVAKILFLK